jgi:hypothetical protein
VDELIRLVPHVLPVIGEEPASPVLVAVATDYPRRLRVDDLVESVALPWEEWKSLLPVLPGHSCELEMLARALDGLRDRFDGEDELHQEELAAHIRDYNARVARGVKRARLRWPAPPERRIYREELDCLRSCLALVVEAIGPEVSGKAVTVEVAASGPAVEATLGLIPRGTHSRNLIQFLAKKPGRKAKLKEVCERIYKVVNKDSIKKTALLIKRTSLVLDDRTAPLRLVRDGYEVKLASIDITEAT